MSDFDYGTEDVPEAGKDFKNPEIGDHTARLRSIIHCGMYRENSKKYGIKKPAPQVVAIFELKDEEDFEDDGVTPLTIHKSFPLKKGDKSFATAFRKAFDPKGKASGFDDFIGEACQISCVGSKVTNDDGTPKYVNFGGVTGLPAKFAKMIDPLAVEGVGHVRFENLTKEAILELNPILDVANVLMKGEKYEGSVAEQIVEEIRKENPDFAVPKKKDDSSEEKSEAKDEVETDLKDEDY